MWIAELIIAMCLILIGFLCGIMAEGMHGNNEEMFRIDRRIKKLERWLENVSDN